MRGIRISLACLFDIIFYFAIVFAALRTGSNDWFKAAYTLTLAVFLYAAIVARYRGPFWHGFAIAGLAFFVIGFGPWIPKERDALGLNRNLLTSVIAERVSGALEDQRQEQLVRDKQRINRAGTCHAALAIVIALSGGLVAALTESRCRRRTEK
jgi:hypothetical protein